MLHAASAADDDDNDGHRDVVADFTVVAFINFIGEHCLSENQDFF